MRKLRRMVARERMKKAGLTQVCKHKTGRSYFAENWRDYIF